MDGTYCAGAYPVRPAVPAVGGTEGVGVVVGVAPGVRTLKINDWVIPAHPHLGPFTFWSIAMLLNRLWLPDKIDGSKHLDKGVGS